MSILENTAASWSKRAELLCSPYDAVGWSVAGQQERFAAVLAAVELQPDDVILDFGCGTGALCDALPPDVAYHGHDFAPGMVDRARAEHPEKRFRFWDSLPVLLADVVVCVGPFNLPGSWSKERTWHTLRHLWDATGCRVLAASLYAGDDERCLRYTEAEAEACGRQLAFGATVVRHRPNDLLLVARRYDWP